jgi:DNA polymerase (family X)
MTNASIADQLTLLAKLMDIHGENSFKSKSYVSAAFTIDKLTDQLSEIPTEKIFLIKGIGDSTAKKIIELLQTGALKQLTDLIEKTPEGIVEMMQIKGIGPKKIATIWKEMEIENIGELLYACKENRLKLYKGFGEKTQQNIAETITYFLNSKGNLLYAQANLLVENIFSFLQKIFLDTQIELTGAIKRQQETVAEIEFVVNKKTNEIEQLFLSVADFELIEKMDDAIIYKSTLGFKIKLYGCTNSTFIKQVFTHNCSIEFLAAFTQKFGENSYANYSTEAEIFTTNNIDFIPAFARENEAVLLKAINKQLPTVIQPSDIKGIVHSHSKWSDGEFTIEEMAIAAQQQGFEYLVLSDHSKSAFYANGLQEERIKAQHIEIEALNKKLHPFKIFKSIESDILNDGSLDYSNAILSTFDLVIASIHSNLKMPEEKAMQRLITAIENPYTTILGHLTGRLLLSRKGYPINHKLIIDACAANKVIIELNAHPSRLDIDWRYIDYALEKNVLISINPDAHFIDGYKDVQYGVWVAQKALLTKEQNFSSFSLQQVEQYLSTTKKW